MQEKNDDDKKIIIGTVVVGIIFVILGLIFHSDKAAWMKGVTFGTIFTTLKLVLMHKTITQSVEMNELAAKKHTIRQYAMRYVLTGVVLAVAASEPSIDFLGVCAGLIAMKITIYCLLILGKISR